MHIQCVVCSVVPTPDGTLFVSTSSRYLYKWDTPSSDIVKKVQGYK